jgi:hypothetical protein
MFRVPIQACIGVKVIASEAIAPYRKDVLAKWCAPHAHRPRAAWAWAGGRAFGPTPHPRRGPPPAALPRRGGCGRVQGALQKRIGLRGAPHPLSLTPTPRTQPPRSYGGDISRKKKLLNKQAEGKKRMKSLGKVDVPQEAFMAVLKIDRDSSDD